MTEVSVLLEHFPYIGLFILLILGGIGLPFPEDATLILCGFLLSHKFIKPIPAFLVVYSGTLIADIFLFYVGKKYGTMVVSHKRFHNILSPERLLILEEKFKKWGVFFILLGRHLVGIRAQLLIVAGVMKMSLLKFFLADAVSLTFTVTLMVGAGYLGGNSLQIIKKDISRIEHVAIFLIIILIVVYLFYRYFKARQDKMS